MAREGCKLQGRGVLQCKISLSCTVHWLANQCPSQPVSPSNTDTSVPLFLSIFHFFVSISHCYKPQFTTISEFRSRFQIRKTRDWNGATPSISGSFWILDGFSSQGQISLAHQEVTLPLDSRPHPRSSTRYTETIGNLSPEIFPLRSSTRYPESIWTLSHDIWAKNQFFMSLHTVSRPIPSSGIPVNTSGVAWIFQNRFT